MVNCIDYYSSGVYQNKANSKVFESEFNKTNKNKNVSFGLSKPKKKLNELIDKNKEFLTTCTDGEDDGKIGFKEGAKAFLGGVANHYLGFIEKAKDYIKKNPVKTGIIGVGAVAIGALVIATLGAPAAMGILSIAGISLGIKGLISGIKGAVCNIKSAKDAQTDPEKKQALYGLGGNSAEIVESAIAIYGGAKGLKESIKVLSQTDDVARALNKDELKILQEFYDKRDAFFEGKSIAKIIRQKFVK